METAQTHVRRQTDNYLARRRIITTGEHIAIDIVREFLQMLRGDVLERRNYTDPLPQYLLNGGNCRAFSRQLHARYFRRHKRYSRVDQDLSLQYRANLFDRTALCGEWHRENNDLRSSR